MRKRILFVDDEPLLARTYVMVLQSQSDRWEVRSVTSAVQALELVNRLSFDVVVADLRMPGMNGVDLINEIRKHQPQASRVIISGIRDQEEVARCLGATHQFIPKPVDLQTLQDTLARICNLDAYLPDEKLRALVGQFDALPSFPALYIEVVGELAAADASLERVAEIVSQDPAMTAKMLQIVNSAAFGLARSISNSFEAVQFLGTGTIRSLVLSVHVFSCFEQKDQNFSMQEFWQHSLRSAALARAICRSADVDTAIAEEAYIAGMLHDVGKLMLASRLPQPFQQAMQLAVTRSVPLHAVESEIFGATHSQVGAYLLGLWGLPTTIVEAVAFHHSPAKSEPKAFGPLSAVHIADALENELSPSAAGKMVTLDAGYLSALGVQDKLEQWRAEAAQVLRVRAG